MAALNQVRDWGVVTLALAMMTYLAYNFVDQQLGMLGFALFALTLFTTIKKAIESV